jgi:hypothetical protein
MFLTFQKITTATPSKKSKILVNSESMLLLDVDTFENKELGVQYDATRIEVIGFPNHKFHTLTTFNDVLTYVPAIDLTQGLGIGSQCAGTPGVLNFVQPSIQFPLIKTLAVFNNSLETREYAFNPNFIVYAEEVKYGGNGQYTGLMISLRDTQPRQILTKLALSDLISILDPIEIQPSYEGSLILGGYLLLNSNNLVL